MCLFHIVKKEIQSLTRFDLFLQRGPHTSATYPFAKPPKSKPTVKKRKQKFKTVINRKLQKNVILKTNRNQSKTNRKVNKTNHKVNKTNRKVNKTNRISKPTVVSPKPIIRSTPKIPQKDDFTESILNYQSPSFLTSDNGGCYVMEVKEYKKFEPFKHDIIDTPTLTRPSNNKSNARSELQSCAHCKHCRNTVWDCPQIQHGFMLQLFIEKTCKEYGGKMSGEMIKRKYGERYALLGNYINTMAQYNKDLVNIPQRIPQCMIEGLYSVCVEKWWNKH